MNRRAFACLSAAFAAAPMAAWGAPSALPSLRSARSRLAIASYPFRQYMVAPENNRRNAALKGMDVLQFAAFVVSEFGLHGIEVVNKHFEALEPEYLRGVRAGLAKQKVALVNIPMDSKSQLCGPDRDTKEAAMKLHCDWIDAAVTLGCPSVRMRMPMGPDPATLDVACACEAMRAVAKYARRRGIVLSIENDSPKTEKPEQIIAVIKAAGGGNVHSLPDFANGLAEGDVVSNAEEMRQLFPYAYNIAHAKDWEHIHGVRQDISLRQIVNISLKAGFKGWYSLESDSVDDPTGDTHRLLDAMLACLGRSAAS